MKKEERKIIYYAKNGVEKYASLIVQVDSRGEAWLSPDQINYLELKHAMAEYEGVNESDVSNQFTDNVVLQPPIAEKTENSDLGASFTLSYP